MESEYVHIIINLFVVLFLVVLFVFILKKVKLGKAKSGKHIKVLNIISISPKERVVLIEVNDTCLLLGSTPNQITTLHVFDALTDTTKQIEHYVSQPSFANVMEQSQLQL